MTPSATYIHLDYLRLMADNDEDMIQTMIAMLLEELPQEFQLLRSSYENGDWEQLSRISHKMKSTLAFVGNETLSQANKMIESYAKNCSGRVQIADFIAVMDRMMPLVLEELQQLIHE